MPKVSPARNNFNAGVWSILAEGRTDHERYPASTRETLNGIAAQQGPYISRSGSEYLNDVFDHTRFSHLIPFTYSEVDSVMLEFCETRLRIHFDDGIQTWPAVAVTAVLNLNPLKITMPGHGAAVGDQIILTGFPAVTNVNGVPLNITFISGDDIVFGAYGYTGALGAVAAFGSRVFSIVTPYSNVRVREVRGLQFENVMYLFCEGYNVQKLTRMSGYVWTLNTTILVNGPYQDEVPFLGVLTLNATGTVAVAGTPVGDNNPADAFDGSLTTFWDSGINQGGVLGYALSSGTAVKGYTLYIPNSNTDVNYASVDYAPSSWTFEASFTGGAGTWEILDAQSGYLLYDNGRSVHFPVNNIVPYLWYKIVVTACTRNGPINPRVSLMTLTNAHAVTIGITLSGTFANLNNNAGFIAGDVQRQIRLKAADNNYRNLEIVTVTDATHITAQLNDEPFPYLAPVLNWAPGLFSNAIGWPHMGAFFEDRLWLMSKALPNTAIGSRPGLYEDFTTKTPTNVVLDDSAIRVRLNTGRMSTPRWIETDQTGLLIATGSNGWVINAANQDNALTARNIKGRVSTRRGAADFEPVIVDSDIIFGHVAARTLHELTYNWQGNVYTSPSLSLFSSHLGSSRMVQMVYSAEPHSIIYARREDGSLIGLTYNKTENVVGWHTHDYGGLVESIAVKPNVFTSKDDLWFVLNRTINGNTRRYIERLRPYWDFDQTLATAQFVDCSLRYTGAPTNVVYGFSHLEGELVEGLADGIPFQGVHIVSGTLTLPNGQLASNVVAGKAYISECEIARIEAGAADGTAQGKNKRIHNCGVLVWDSAFGEVANYDDDKQEYVYTDMVYRDDYVAGAAVVLQTDMRTKIVLAPVGGPRGAVKFRRTKPLPFNVIALYPQLDVQDG